MLRKELAQPGQGQQIPQVIARVVYQDLAAEAPCGQLQPRQSFDDDGVRFGDGAHVADDHSGVAVVQQRGEPGAEPGDVGPSDSGADGPRVRSSPVVGWHARPPAVIINVASTSTDRLGGGKSSRLVVAID
jgi:hypothetical protein